MTAFKYLTVVLMLAFMLTPLACASGDQVRQAQAPTATPSYSTWTPPPPTPTISQISTFAPQDLTATEMADSLVACFERDEEIWNAYKDILRPTAQEMGMPDSFLDNLKPADIYPTMLGEFEAHPESRRPYVNLLADCEARSSIAASPTVANPTPNIPQTVAAAIVAANPPTAPTVPPLALASTETPSPTPWSRPTLPPRTPFPTLTPIPAPVAAPTAILAVPAVPAKADWSVENDAAYDYRSITSADKTQRWTCIGAGRPRINITHPAAHTVATAVAERTAEDKDTIINGESYKLAWAAWSSNPSWTPEEHALNVRHGEALQLKRSLVSSGATSFSVSIGSPPVVGHYSTDGLIDALTRNKMQCFN